MREWTPPSRKEAYEELHAMLVREAMSQLGVRQDNDTLAALRVIPHSQQEVGRCCPFSQASVTRTNKGMHHAHDKDEMDPNNSTRWVGGQGGGRL